MKYDARELKDFVLKLSGVMEYMTKKRSIDSNGRNVTLYCCKLCGYESKYLTNCREHMLYKHAEPEHLSCEFCGHVSTNRPSYRKHKGYCMKKQKFRPY